MLCKQVTCDITHLLRLVEISPGSALALSSAWPSVASLAGGDCPLVRVALKSEVQSLGHRAHILERLRVEEERLKSCQERSQDAHNLDILAEAERSHLRVQALRSVSDIISTTEAEAARAPAGPTRSKKHRKRPRRPQHKRYTSVFRGNNQRAFFELAAVCRACLVCPSQN
eukprot:SAG11_NODE_347_length_10420_cov_5.267997_4_plen_171_part_00